MQCETYPKTTVPGGYTLLTPVVLCNLLSALENRRIALRAARTFVACVLMKAVREGAAAARQNRSVASCSNAHHSVHYSVDELHQWVGGVGGGYLKDDLRRLDNLGLLQFSSSAIALGMEPIPLARDRLAMVCGDRYQSRKIPVPRRLLQYLCQCTRPSLFKVVLAYLLRGLWFKRGGLINPKGSAKASWLAYVAGISLRAAKEARKILVSLGWLGQDGTTSQWKLNRTGAHFTINLAWIAPRKKKRCFSGSSIRAKPMAETAPLTRFSTTEVAPPKRNKNLPRGIQTNQNLGSPSCSGSFEKRGLQENPQITNVKESDLKSLPRLMMLFETAHQEGMVEHSEANLLNWVSAAVRATTNKVRDPVRVFMGIVRQKLWHHITQKEENQARLLIQRHRSHGLRPTALRPSREATHVGEILKSLNDRIKREVILERGEGSPSQMTKDNLNSDPCGIRGRGGQKEHSTFQV